MKKAFAQNKNHSRRFLSGISTLENTKAVETPDTDTRGWNKINVILKSFCSGPQPLTQKQRGPEQQPLRTTTVFGFTLIELLVVVLIIGILSAIALPQYQKAVEKSKAAQAVTMLKSVYQAAEEYYLANGAWPASFADLSVAPAWTGTEKWYTDPSVKESLSDGEWSLQMVKYMDSQGGNEGVNIGRISGKNKGGGFVMWHKYTYFNNTVLLNAINCVEVIADIETPGDYCQKVMQSGSLIAAGSTLRYYKMQ